MADHAVHNLEFTIKYANYPLVFVQSAQPEFKLTIKDECRLPAINVGGVVTNAVTYNFDNANPASFDMTGLTVSPVSCIPSYACAVTSDPGPTIDATF